MDIHGLEWAEIRSGLTFDVRGRRSGKAAEGTHKRSLWAVPLDGIVSQLRAIA